MLSSKRMILMDSTNTTTIIYNPELDVLRKKISLLEWDLSIIKNDAKLLYEKYDYDDDIVPQHLVN